MSIRQTNRHAVIRPASEIKTGSMFKTNGAWFRAAEDAQEARATAPHDYEVLAQERNGFTVRVLIYFPQVELAREGYIPPTFQPATLRREAARLQAQAKQLADRAGSMLDFALQLSGDS